MVGARASRPHPFRLSEYRCLHECAQSGDKCPVSHLLLTTMGVQEEEGESCLRMPRVPVAQASLLVCLLDSIRTPFRSHRLT